MSSPARSSVKRALLRAVLLSGWVAAGPAVAAPEHGQSFRDWAAACEEPKSEAESVTGQCYIFQNIALKESGQRLLHMAVGLVGGPDRPAAVVTLPLGVYLPPGIGLSVDGGEPVRFPIQQCVNAGCRGVLPLAPAMVASLKAGRQARVTFQDGNRREIAVPVSLLGFTAGFNALVE